jgi:hypothetical protein
VTQVDCVLDKALRVLGHAELFEPGRNLLQRSAPLSPACKERRPE